MVEPVDHEDWFIHIAGEFGLLAESVASLRLSSGQVGEAQQSFYLGRVVLGIEHLHSATTSWREDIDRYVKEMEQVEEVDLDLDDNWLTAAEIRGDEDRVRLGHGHRTFPYDLPVTIEVCRLMDDIEEDGKKVRKLAGWGLKITTTIKPEVEITIGIQRDPAIVHVEATDGNGGCEYEWTADEPIRPPVNPGLDGQHDAANPQNMKHPVATYAATEDDDPIIDDDEPDFIAEDQDDIIMDDDDIIEED